MERRQWLKIGGNSAMVAALVACGGGGGRPAIAQCASSPARKRVTTSDGVNLSVIDTGGVDKQPIVFIHGIAQSALSWRAQFSSSELLAKYRLIAVDLRGHGQSQGALGALDDTGRPLAALASNKYSIANDDVASSALWANDVAAVISGLSLNAPVLVGWSYGATVIADYMRVNQGLGAAKKIVLTGGSPVLLPPGTPGGGGADTVLSPAFFATYPKTLDFNRLTNAPSTYHDVVTGLADFVQLALSDAVSGRAPATRDEVLENVAFNVLAPPAARQAISRASDFRPFFTGLSAATRSRVKIINGGADAVNQTTNTKAYYEACGFTVTNFSGEGHSFFARNPSLFNTELDTFISAA
ncbi:MAG TPA: alpha/beta hydrolase [Burkholderiaceae bacterium]|nr:alpha/beta hydrolase [Burkholderiaceae bacterium]